MTLVLSYMDYGRVVQVSDRLVVMPSVRGGYEKFEERFNKSLVVRFSDGLYVIGYSGVSYLHSLPIDEFIIRSFISKIDYDGLFSESVGRRNFWVKRTVGKCIIQLAEDFKSVLKRDSFKSYHFEVVFVGVQRKKRLMLPQIHKLLKPIGSMKFEWQRLSPNQVRSFASEQRYQFDITPFHNSIKEGASCLSNKMYGMSSEEIVVTFSEIIREFSSKTDTVGSDSQSIVLDYRRNPSIVLGYHAAGGEFESDTVYTPWLSSRQGLYPPHYFTSIDGVGGKFCVFDGRFSVLFKRYENSPKYTGPNKEKANLILSIDSLKRRGFSGNSRKK